MPAGDGHGRRRSSASQAKATFLERAWAWIHATFPERQIYIRSDGRVQFFTFGPSLQATLAGLTLIFLGWVAFATVNVIFKDRIIAAKDHRYQQMQAAYENRVADLQISYDELNGALVSAPRTASRPPPTRCRPSRTPSPASSTAPDQVRSRRRRAAARRAAPSRRRRAAATRPRPAIAPGVDVEAPLPTSMPTTPAPRS